MQSTYTTLSMSLVLLYFYLLSAISQARMNRKTKEFEVQGTLLLLKKMPAL